MKIRDALFIVGAIVAIVGYFLPFSDLQNIISNKAFSVQVSELFRNGTQFEVVSIKNVAFTDAENVIVRIESYDSIKNVIPCLDSTFTSDEYSQEIKISVDKILVSSSCSMTLESDSDEGIWLVSVVADNLPRYVWIQGSTNLELMNSFILLGFIIVVGALVMTVLYFRDESGAWHTFSLEPSVTAQFLRSEYGPGFTDDDELIIEAMNKGKKSIKDIAIFTNLKEKHVRERLKFMEKKGHVKTY